MESNPKEQLIQMIKNSSEKELAEVYEMALKMHLSSLQNQQKQIEREIAKAKKELEGLSSAPTKIAAKKTAARNPSPTKPVRRRRSGPRVSDVIRQTLKDARGPLQLSKITEAVSKATSRPLTGNLRSYVSQLLRREPTVRRLSRGMYAITI